ncbi:hypothetical protein HBB16_16745 [Pseudonocardia sp. MCCB 268]|nr:hypothetical protein [Pseudonocardia cytotoxica]
MSLPRAVQGRSAAVGLLVLTAVLAGPDRYLALRAPARRVQYLVARQPARPRRRCAATASSAGGSGRPFQRRAGLVTPEAIDGGRVRCGADPRPGPGRRGRADGRGHPEAVEWRQRLRRVPNRPWQISRVIVFVICRAGRRPQEVADLENQPSTCRQFPVAARLRRRACSVGGGGPTGVASHPTDAIRPVSRS